MVPPRIFGYLDDLLVVGVGVQSILPSKCVVIPICVDQAGFILGPTALI